MVDYDVVADAARQIFKEKNAHAHPFFRPYFASVFASYAKTHEDMRLCADSSLDVLDDNLTFVKRTVQLCDAISQVEKNSRYNGCSTLGTKIETGLAINGKLMAVLTADPAKAGGWLFARYLGEPNQSESVRFTITDKPSVIDTMVFDNGAPNDYVRLTIMSGLKAIGRPTPILWGRNRCSLDQH